MNLFLLATAALLGLLSFFEPCTIATHTLFSVRLHGEPPRGRLRGLLALWLSRSLLLAVLFAGLVALTPRPDWGPVRPSIILTVMGLVYIISRFIYLPVPHLAFHKVIPGGGRLPDSVQLGLTIPACMLPLVIVTAGLAITADSPVAALLAALLFAGLFNLPLLYVTARGMSEGLGRFLSGVAKVMPFFTSLLLFGGALSLVLPGQQAGLAFLYALPEANLVGIGLAFLVGLLFSFNPVSLAAIPLVAAYVTRTPGRRAAVLQGGAFVLGILVTHALLGLVAGAGGTWARALMGPRWGLVLGPFLILLGLIWPGWLKIRLPWFGFRGRKTAGAWGAFLLGVPYSIAVCPFCTPALMALLLVSASFGSPLYGAALLLAFALGRSVTVLLGAWAMGWLESLKFLSRYQRAFEWAGGVTMILVGLYFINGYYRFLPL